MYKFFVEDNQINGNEIKIINEDVKHISNVLRLKKDDKIIVCNKDNAKSYITEIIQFNKEFVKCKIIEEENVCTESKIDVDIFQGLPKADKMEWIIQKATELGVKNIYPVQMERSIVKIDEKSEEKKLERWQKIAEVAAKQSKRDVIPEIKNIINIENICKIIGNYDKILMAYESEELNTLKQELKKLDRTKKIKIGIIIGPEGGLSKKEVDVLIDNGVASITLGKRILRTETASLVILSDIIYEFEL